VSETNGTRPAASRLIVISSHRPISTIEWKTGPLVDGLDMPAKFLFLAMLAAGVGIFVIEILAYGLRQLN
jgi:hypothetical protein